MATSLTPVSPAHVGSRTSARTGITLISGGARSGKSRLALQLALESGSRRCFIATADAFDEEMRQRIARHREERAGYFDTVEAGLDLPDQLTSALDYDVVVIDCVTLFLSRVLLSHEREPLQDQERGCEMAAMNLLRRAEKHESRLIVVTNEVGMGVVPISALGRTFRDVAGRTNQLLAEHADELYLATMGVALRLRPAPVLTVPIDKRPLGPPSNECEL